MKWFKNYTLQDLEGFRNANMGQHIGMKFTDIGDDYLCASMPVDHRTVQPFGRLHGGASCVLSESLGSVAAWMCIDPDIYAAVGIEINANHISTAWDGKGDVIGKCTPFHIGRSTHVWQTDIMHAVTGKRVCISRLTVAIVDKPS
jgi:1,4-dihydroxy-2-naphthoyl-CoA hydrolase